MRFVIEHEESWIPTQFREAMNDADQEKMVDMSFEKGQLKRIGLHNAREPNIARCLTLLTRHSNHHEKEHEIAEKNKGCHYNVPPFAAISSAHRSIIFWMRSEPLARI